MATPFPFGSGNVLTAAQMNAITTLPINDQTASYVALVGDVGKRIVMNVATANTVTINNSVFAVGDTIFVANKGAGSTTLTAGAGVTINTSSSLVLAQHGGGTLVALSASVFTFFSGSAPVNTVEYLVIAGGGGGGTGTPAGGGGGGGAGGYRSSVTAENSGGGVSAEFKIVPIAATNYTVTVGAGGAASSNGSNSVFGTTVISTGGGRGGYAGDGTGASGGSGGGGLGRGDNNFRAGGAGTTGQGFAGSGSSGALYAVAGGGGGAGAAASGINGAVGVSSSITGSSVQRAGGGGGYLTGTATGGGGAGGATGVAGTANTGGGGGGGDTGGGAGGSGVVIFSYPSGFTITIGAGLTGSTTTVGSNKVTTITAGTGNVQWN